MLARDADGLAAEVAAFLEYAVSASADIFDGDSRKLLVAHGKCDRQPPLRSLLGAHAEVNEVVPIEGRQQERGGNIETGEKVVGFALGVKVRHLVVAHEGGHAVVSERHPLAGIFK